MYRGIRYLIQITGVAIFVAAPFCISGADYIHKASIKTKHSQREAKILEKKIGCVR